MEHLVMTATRAPKRIPVKRPNALAAMPWFARLLINVTTLELVIQAVEVAPIPPLRMAKDAMTEMHALEQIPVKQEPAQEAMPWFARLLINVMKLELVIQALVAPILPLRMAKDAMTKTRALEPIPAMAMEIVLVQIPSTSERTSSLTSNNGWAEWIMPEHIRV
jgi:hypothetical protein